MDIETQIGHAVLLIRSVAFEAIVGENGADFAVEINLTGRWLRRAKCGVQDQQNGKSKAQYDPI